MRGKARPGPLPGEKRVQWTLFSAERRRTLARAGVLAGSLPQAGLTLGHQQPLWLVSRQCRAGGEGDQAVQFILAVAVRGHQGSFDTECRGAFVGDLVGLGRDADGDRDRVEPLFLRPVADLLADVAVGDDVHHHIRAGAAVRGHARGRHHRGERGDVVVGIAAVVLRRGQLDDLGLARQRSGGGGEEGEGEEEGAHGREGSMGMGE